MKTWQKISLILLVFATIVYIKLAFFTGSEVAPPTDETAQEQEEAQKMPKIYTYIFFVGQNADKEEVYKAVKREYPEDTDDSKLKFALTNLLKGPSAKERTKGVYTEIPSGTRLLSIEELPNKIIINLSSDFETGGGTDSLYKRLYQLIKTVNKNSDTPVYLQLNGKQIDVIGGEGL
ncbi:MAG TPA: GerMN domain-containing protein, partial [Candidatus Gastranaerophilaceae bacterium]|nr:GerMN domain-containing protein [Candidatus Gastranaerophilaceae bacterium]